MVADGESGFVVPQGDADAFADRFEQLLTDDGLWIRFHEASQSRLASHFDQERMYDEYEALLRGIIDGDETMVETFAERQHSEGGQR
ncbi:hypothetical protein GJ629_01850 [Halapricum sp. CBA1109]|uniref:glycosyltransferase n=1 Tax=Halapricum sp. CBA1109 TaxID=2668068 RepID=UPI0012FC6D4A|nr:hypothetical protein [Halapricum sp. CBA1109]MUV88783.1 hypothetical protein [Halapricum sp. CBA1109]